MNKPLPLHDSATRYWWIRHAPVTHLKHQMYGNRDVLADVSDIDRFERLAAALPENATCYTSQLQRAAQTADAVAEAGLAYRRRDVSEAIAEMNFGELTGSTHRELIERRDDAFIGFWPVSPLQQTVPGGETFTEMIDRVQQFMHQCNEKHAGEDVICYSHMGPILAALAVALDLPDTSRVSFSIDNLSITRIHHHANLQPGAPEYRVLQVASR